MPSHTVLTACSLAAGALALAACGSSSSSSSTAGASGASGTAVSESGTGQYCTLAKAVADSSNGLSALTPTADLNQVKSLLAGFTAAVDAAAAAAPSSMASDWNTLKTAYDGAASDIAAAKTTNDAFTVLSSKFDTPTVNTAGKNVDTATKTQCGFTISSSAGSTGSPAAPSPATTDTGGSNSGTETVTSSSSS